VSDIGQSSVTATTYSAYVNSPIDIFRRDAKGVVWIGSAENADSARTKIDELCSAQPGDYVAFDQEIESILQIQTLGGTANGSLVIEFNHRQSQLSIHADHYRHTFRVQERLSAKSTSA
jgi:hypothetical protein